MSTDSGTTPTADLDRRVRTLARLVWLNTGLLVAALLLVGWSITVAMSTQDAVADFLADMRGAFLPK